MSSYVHFYVHTLTVVLQVDTGNNMYIHTIAELKNYQYVKYKTYMNTKYTYIANG